MSELIFAQQQQWSTASADQARLMFINYAADLGLDTERFSADLEQGVYAEIVQASYIEAVAQQLSGTPTIFVNGQLFQAPLSYYWLDAFVRLELLTLRQYDSAPEMTIDPSKQYRAIIRTVIGDIVVELDAENAPLTVNNFVFLAQQGWYDGVSFFRVLPGFVAQSGDPTNTGLGGPGYDLPAEIGLLHEPGAIAMARQSDQVNPERRSSGSQFYIALDTLLELDGAYTVFGYVVEGMDVALALTPRDPSQSLDLPPGDEIMTIEIQE
jgi:cyclophilin family peptidyl-prolyl cis-trans isomerase